MAERGSMTALVDLVERLVNDPSNEAHSREDIQAALDVYRMETRYGELAPLATLGVGGASYLTFQAASGYWEGGAVLFDASYTVLTPATSDLAGGRWTLATEPARPVTVVGWTHDPYLAAADLLEVRAAQLAEEYDFSTGPDSFSRNQRVKNLREQADRYRAMSPRNRAKAESVTALIEMPPVVSHVFTY